jgi:hypothetical protein
MKWDGVAGNPLHPACIVRGMKLNYGKNNGYHNIASLTREGRPCSAMEIASQIGKMNVLAVSGGRLTALRDAEGEEVGLILPITSDRRVEVVLDWSDTYTVRRVRYITKGKDAGNEVVEFEKSDIYCDEVGEMTYTASCWK